MKEEMFRKKEILRQGEIIQKTEVHPEGILRWIFRLGKKDRKRRIVDEYGLDPDKNYCVSSKTDKGSGD